jgi:hypothetical protein
MPDASPQPRPLLPLESHMCWRWRGASFGVVRCPSGSTRATPTTRLAPTRPPSPHTPQPAYMADNAPACKSEARFNFAVASSQDELVHGAARPGAPSQRCFPTDASDRVTPAEGAGQAPAGLRLCCGRRVPEAQRRLSGSALPAVEEYAAFMEGHGVRRVVSLLSSSELATYQEPPVRQLAARLKRAVAVDAKVWRPAQGDSFARSFCTAVRRRCAEDRPALVRVRASRAPSPLQLMRGPMHEAAEACARETSACGWVRAAGAWRVRAAGLGAAGRSRGRGQGTRRPCTRQPSNGRGVFPSCASPHAALVCGEQVVV